MKDKGRIFFMKITATLLNGVLKKLESQGYTLWDGRSISYGGHKCRKKLGDRLQYSKMAIKIDTLRGTISTARQSYYKAQYPGVSYVDDYDYLDGGLCLAHAPAKAAKPGPVTPGTRIAHQSECVHGAYVQAEIPSAGLITDARLVISKKSIYVVHNEEKGIGCALPTSERLGYKYSYMIWNKEEPDLFCEASYNCPTLIMLDKPYEPVFKGDSDGDSVYIEDNKGIKIMTEVMLDKAAVVEQIGTARELNVLKTEAVKGDSIRVLAERAAAEAIARLDLVDGISSASGISRLNEEDYITVETMKHKTEVYDDALLTLSLLKATEHGEIPAASIGFAPKTLIKEAEAVGTTIYSKVEANIYFS